MMEYLLPENAPENNGCLFDIAHSCSNTMDGTPFQYVGFPRDILELDICEVEGFTTRIKNALHHIGVKKVGDLRHLSRTDLIITSGLGPKGRDIINSFLETNHLKSNNFFNRNTMVKLTIKKSK